MLAFILRSIGALIASLLVVFVLIMAVEIFSNVVHPLPEGTNITHEEICLHVAKYPAWVLAVVIPMWGATQRSALGLPNALATYTRRSFLAYS